jgi:hypothetical protein
MTNYGDFAVKKDSPAAITTADITASDNLIYVDHCEYFYDASGGIIYSGICIYQDGGDQLTPEEVKLTYVSAASGSGFIVTTQRGVNADTYCAGVNIGTARAWPKGSRVAATFTTGMYYDILSKFAYAIVKSQYASTPGSNNIAIFQDTENDHVVIADSYRTIDSISEHIWNDVTSSFSTTPSGSDALTTVYDLTNIFNYNPGRLLRVIISGTRHYLMIKTRTSSTITVLGTALSGTISSVASVLSSIIDVVHEKILISGAYAASASSTLISDKGGIPGGLTWTRGPARVVAFVVAHKTNDSGATQPTVYPTINGNQVCTAISVSTTKQDSGVTIILANRNISFGDVIELVTTAGTNGDASGLYVELIAVELDYLGGDSVSTAD